MRRILVSIAMITTLSLAGCSSVETTANQAESAPAETTVPITVQLSDTTPLEASINVDGVNCSMTSGLNRPGHALSVPTVVVKDAGGTIVGKADVTKDGVLVENTCVVQVYVGRVAESDFYQVEFADVYGNTHTATGERGTGADTLIPVSF